MIAPINDAALQAGDVSAIRLCHVAFGSWLCENPEIEISDRKFVSTSSI
jgi:hypothetical protein